MAAAEPQRLPSGRPTLSQSHIPNQIVRQQTQVSTARASAPKRDESRTSDCGEDDAASLGRDAYQPIGNQSSTNCRDVCCGGQPEPPANTANIHPTSGQGDASYPGNVDTCGSDVHCCSPVPLLEDVDEQTGTNSLECCHGTTSPSCDDSCHDQLALLACEGEKKAIHIVESFEGMLATSPSTTRSVAIHLQLTTL